jgi:hypothetical protein
VEQVTVLSGAEGAGARGGAAGAGEGAAASAGGGAGAPPVITLADASAHQDGGAEPSPDAALLAGEPGGGGRQNDAWLEWEKETRDAASALIASDNSPENAAMLIDVACHLDGGGRLKPLGAAGTLHTLRRQWEAAKRKTSCFDENLRQLVGTAVGFENFVVWLAGTMNGRRTGGYWRYGIDYPGAPAVVAEAFAALGRTKGGFMRLTVGRGGHCKDVIDLPKAAIPPGGIVPWRRNGPVDVATPYGRDNCVLVAANGAFGGVYLDRGKLSQFDDSLHQGPIALPAVCEVINRCKTPFVLEYSTALSKGGYDIFLRTAGIYVAVLQLTLADGTINFHAICVDGYRDVVSFGYNDFGTDQVAFLIEKADRRDTETARANLLSPRNFPVDENEPGRALVSVDVLQVAHVMLKTKALRFAEHAAYLGLKRAAGTAAGGGGQRGRVGG